MMISENQRFSECPKRGKKKGLNERVKNRNGMRLLNRIQESESGATDAF